MFDLDYLLEVFEKNKTEVISRHRHNYIMYQGIESDYIYFLKEGVVKISSILKDGGEFNIAYVVDPDFVSLLETQEVDTISAVFNIRVETEEASFYKISRRNFWKLVDKDARLLKIVNEFYRRRLAMNLSLFKQMTVHGKKGAVCASLYRMIDIFGIQKKEGVLIDFPITNEDLAGFCGISSRTSVNRILHDLKDEGVIDMIDHKFLLRDLHYLRHYAD